MATSSTQITFIFPFLSTYEVTLGSGSLANKLGCKEMQEKTYNGQQALSVMMGLNVQEALSLFDRGIVNLLVDRHLQREIQMLPPLTDPEECDDLHAGLILVVHHFR